MISAAGAAGGGADAGGGARLLPPPHHLHHHHHQHGRRRAAAVAPPHHARPMSAACPGGGEAWRGAGAPPPGGQPAQAPAELFLRPAPKPLAPAVRSPKEALAASQVFFNYSRYANGLVPGGSANGTRIAPSRPLGKYPSPPNSALPVNLTQPKDDEDMSPYSHYRLFSHPAFPPYYPTFQQPFLLRGFPPTPLSPQELFTATTPNVTSSQTFLSPPATFSPPSTIVKPPQHVAREKRTPPIQTQNVPTSPGGNFKVPSGKEGSLKHRILTGSPGIRPLDLQKPLEGRKRLQATLSPPPGSPKKTLNNNTLPSNFAKGSLIQLATGEYKKIEDMRTEDFVMSADKSAELRLAESTVLKIEEDATGCTTITLTYNQRRAQVEVESTPEHPYFVVGRGWASACPDRSQRCFGLRVHRLQVGDVIVSLTPREGTAPTVATATAKQVQAVSPAHQQGHAPGPMLSPNRKRRWSAPDQLEEEGVPCGRQRTD